VSRLPARNSDRQFPEGRPLRVGERADAVRDALEPVSIRTMQRAQRLPESWALDEDRLVRFELTEPLRLPPHRALALPTHGVDDFCSGCERFCRHDGTPLPDDLIERPRR
jgi:hypothetical protein